MNATVASASDSFGSGSWAQNSIVFYFYPEDGGSIYILWICLGLSLLTLAHSFYLRRWSVSITRVCSDVTALFAGLGAVRFISCYGMTTCSNSTIAIWYSAIDIVVCSGIVQIMDNYMIFYRFSLLIGPHNVSDLHRAVCFGYVVIALYLTWVPFQLLLPFWLNMNSPRMVYYSIIITGYTTIACYVAYDFFYLVWMLQLLHSNETDSNESQKAATRDLGIRAVLHACASIVGIVCYCALWIIYLCLNTRIEDKYLYPKLRPDRRHLVSTRISTDGDELHQVNVRRASVRLVVMTSVPSPADPKSAGSLGADFGVSFGVSSSSSSSSHHHQHHQQQSPPMPGAIPSSSSSPTATVREPHADAGDESSLSTLPGLVSSQ